MKIETIGDLREVIASLPDEAAFTMFLMHNEFAGDNEKLEVISFEAITPKKADDCELILMLETEEE